MADELEHKFDAAMVEIHHGAKSEAGYNGRATSR